jgi:hypothetical protein
MNKKSFFLTLLLLGGLCTPQETKPSALIPLGIFTAFYGFIALDTAGYYQRNHLKKYGIEEQIDIKEYKAYIAFSKNKKVFFEITLNEDNPEQIISKIVKIAGSFEEEKNKALTISCSIIPKSSNKEFLIKTIKIRSFPKKIRSHRKDKLLFYKLKKCFLMKKERPRSFINKAIRETFLVIGGAYLITVYSLLFTFTTISCR